LILGTRFDAFHVLHISPKHLRNAPRLGYASARTMRSVSLENLGDVPETSVLQVVFERL